MPISFAQYEALLKDRPQKFSVEEVNYRDADNLQQRCERCIHYYQRVRDNYGTCEILRPADDEPVDPDYVCDFFTPDGVQYPLRKGR